MARTCVATIAVVLMAFVPQTNVSGEWHIAFVTPLGPQESVMYLTQEGPRLSGHLTSEFGEFPVRGSIADQDVKLSWTLTEQGKSIDVVVTAKVDGDTMKGTAKLGTAGEGPFTAERTSVRR